MRVLKPDTEAAVVDAVQQAWHAQTPLAVEGTGSKRGLGHPVAADMVLKLAGLSGITMYEPDEMVFAARAGTPLREIEETLAANGQCLAFEPGDLAPLWGAPAGIATIGGIVAAGIGGPRRFAAGAPRDHLLGFTAVNGSGERFKAGGRVVKNVTGYDLAKLATGSFGTLCVMTEVTLRALPRGAASMVLALEGLDPREALHTLRAIAASPLDPTGLAFLPAEAATRVGSHTASLTLIRLEGQSDGVSARAADLCKTFAKGAVELDNGVGTKVFTALADIHPFFATGDAVWRLSLPPTRAADAIDRLEPANWIADWAGGLLWLTPKRDAQSAHDVARDLGGHATLFRHADSSPREIFQPLDTATVALTKRLKAAFDPMGILNPGRMYDGI
jgi:glycolate dehydrogenase FAD-binding subunit